jgi:drug/metabolite transporter (DMT)-like permease
LIYRFCIAPLPDGYGLTGYQTGMLIMMGLVRSVSMILFVKAFQLDKAGRAASLNFVQIIFGYSFDVGVFGYQMRWFEVVGATVIVACSVMVFIIKIYKVKE